MKYILAVDGGGSKTKVVCVDAFGKIVGEGMAGPTSLTATSVGAASFNLREGIRQATAGLDQGWLVTKLVMGLAGLDTPEEETQAREVFQQALAGYQINDLVLVNDIEIALASGSDNPNAVALIAGTGSNCFGHNGLGQTAKTGGMDFLLTDQGSGYSIGRAVLRYAVKSYDGRLPATILEELVCNHFHIDSIAQIKKVVYYPLLTKTEIAELTKVCVAAYEQGDVLAKTIYDHTVSSLYEMSSTVINKLELNDKETDFVFVGGVSKIDYIRDTLIDQITKICPQVKFTTQENDPVMGAVKMAGEKVLV